MKYLISIFLLLGINQNTSSQDRIVFEIEDASSDYLINGNYRSARDYLSSRVKTETLEDGGQYSARLAFLMLNGLGGEVNYQKALNLLESALSKSKNNGNVELSVLLLLKNFYDGDFHINRNLSKKFHIESLINYEAPKSHNLIDVFLDFNDYLVRDPYRCAEKYRSKQITQTMQYLWEKFKFLPALNALARIYSYGGFGSTIDKGKALTYFEILEKNKYYPSYDWYCQLIEGDNPSKAYSLSIQAARNDYHRSMHTVLYYYLNGFGVEKDNEKAEYWFKKSIHHGNTFAYLTKAHHYYYKNKDAISSDKLQDMLKVAANGEYGYAYYLLAKTKIESGYKKESVIDLFERGMDLGDRYCASDYAYIKAYGTKQDRVDAISKLKAYPSKWGDSPESIEGLIEVILRMAYHFEIPGSRSDYKALLGAYDEALACIKCPNYIQTNKDRLADWMSKEYGTSNKYNQTSLCTCIQCNGSGRELQSMGNNGGGSYMTCRVCSGSGRTNCR